MNLNFAVRQNANESPAGHRHLAVAEGLNDKEQLQTAQIKMVRLQDEYVRFSKDANLPLQHARMEVAGFNWKDATAAEGAYKTVEAQANTIFSNETTVKNIAAYLKDKPVIDMLALHGVKYIRRIDSKEIIVDAGHPTIQGETAHAVDNQQLKPDRAEMTVEKAQEFVDYAKLTIYQEPRKVLKFLAQEGYAVLNFDHELVTAVPQKWRKKFDKYLEEANK